MSHDQERESGSRSTSRRSVLKALSSTSLFGLGTTSAGTAFGNHESSSSGHRGYPVAEDEDYAGWILEHVEFDKRLITPFEWDYAKGVYTLDYLDSKWTEFGNPREGERGGCWQHTFMLRSLGGVAVQKCGDPDKSVTERNDCNDDGAERRWTTSADSEHLEPLAGTRFEVSSGDDPIAVAPRRDPDLIGFTAGELMAGDDAVRTTTAKGIWKSHPERDTEDLEKIHARSVAASETNSFLVKTAIQGLTFSIGRLTRPAVGDFLAVANVGVSTIADDMVTEDQDGIERFPATDGFAHELPIESPDMGHYAVFDVYVAPNSPEADELTAPPSITVRSKFDVQYPLDDFQDEVIWELEFDSPPEADRGTLDPEGLFFARLDENGATNVPKQKWEKGQPRPGFVADPEVPTPGEEATLYASQHSEDPDGPDYRLEFDWTIMNGNPRVDFDEVTIEGQATVPFTFPEKAQYDVTLTATDEEGAKSSTKRSIFALPPPDIELDVTPSTATPVQSIRFDASGSETPGDRDLEYEWQVFREESFGDAGTGLVREENGVAWNDSFDAPGEYRVDLTVTDNFGKSATESANFTVENDSMAVITGVPDFVYPGETFTLDGSNSVPPEGDLIVDWTWYVDGSLVQEGPHPTLEFEADDVTEHSVTLWVETENGRRGKDTATVTVGGGDELRAVITPEETDVNTGEEFSVSGEYSVPPEGDLIVDWTWYVDGGKVQEGTDPVLEYEAHDDEHTVTLWVTTHQGKSDSESTTIDVDTDGGSNNPPTAELDTTPSADDGVVVVDTEETVWFDATDSSDSDGDTLGYSWDGAAEYSTGKARNTYYEYGDYSVTVTVSDGNGGQDKESVDIRVEPSEIQP